MRRNVRRVTSPDGLSWKVKRLLLPMGMRPLSAIDLLESATPRRTLMDGGERVPDAVHSWTGPLPLGVLFVPLMLPLLPAVLLLRRLRLLPWTVEARSHPWGRRFPPIVHSCDVRGGKEATAAVGELADRLARGERVG
jgi:hypothetical protein